MNTAAALADTSPKPSPWHAGELAMQRAAGVEERMDAVGRRNLRDHLIEQHRLFYPQLPFVVLGAVDPAGDVWATLRAQRPGFLHAPDAHRLHVALERDADDPADAGMQDGAALALLGIELPTRRRNRLNGTVQRNAPYANAGFDLLVEHSYGNCPQYIFQRDAAFVRDPAQRSEIAPVISDQMDERARAIVARADSFYVATYVDRDDGHRQVDVSHRGGKAGFVRVDERGVFTVPDFAGNLFFNTLGNIVANPRAGLVFVDYATGDLLQLTGAAEVLLDSPEIAAFQGAERLWRFTPQRVIFRAGALPLRWTARANGASPNSALTGDWSEADERMKAQALENTWRPFTVARIADESRTIRSFYLQPADGAGLVRHEAGQHLPIRVTLPGDTKPTLRTYTLSVAPSDGLYRISVKREGRVSRYLHDVIKRGDRIEARAPAGNFTIDARATRPAVLLAAGIGITPMLAMLRHLVYEGLRTRHIRPSWLLYAARTQADRAFDEELQALVRAAGGAVTLVNVLSDSTGATSGSDYQALGRIDMAMLGEVLPFNDYDFYLCGPGGFMQSIYDGLRGLNIADARIHAEAFGPAALKRKADASAPPATPPRASAGVAVPVRFARATKEVQWNPQTSGTLLDLAEANGLTPEFSCRGGSCGTCRTRIIEGAVAYPDQPPAATVGENEALICCAVPAAGDDGTAPPLVLDL
ncbi:2Fe-2S iron-sulfur cluster binding domain-containing protein [Paraburkholderia sp. Ac-20340]|uniref:2Fe-2S iron-sulfur cluster-binding protein n=1 Tax=Paraburkholderia sp. Ac-20340 TaxID=2703888 RepID=UPI00197F65BD|nr:pyridoxamine 5'-phosphate oxidase family protein [Paraburkholderia sp. Ac-20340]MBN3857436.1 2Fe-2S iron-sulfur cluster binding domain-containing protein [Paraburkholderia sp. Ac-20340]